jgi:hypothetical protein
VTAEAQTNKCLSYTGHSESIQTPWLPHFVTLQPYSKMDSIVFSPHQSTHNFSQGQSKNTFFEFLQMYKKKKLKYLVYILQVFRPFSMRPEIELRCILFPLIILEMFLQLDWSTPVVNSIDWTWFGKAPTCLYKVPQLTVHVRAKTKPWGQRHSP